MSGVVYLLGAGPGDPELITRRALRCLREADVVLYDALVHGDLLGECRDDAEKVFVGKRAGKPSARQDRINARLAEEALRGKKVARLKGGDPYLFGRGSQEAAYLANAGVRFEVVPGVPSPLAATAYAGLSLTHRDLASSVAYVTATESVEKDASAHDWERLATATQTLVIFMGMRKLESLMKRLVDNGRSPTTPVAVVQWASLPKQRTVVGTVADIAAKAREAKLGLPALTIVGDVVRLRDSLRWFDTKPLFGKRVLVTRPSHQAGSLSALLRDRGALPIELPCIRVVDARDPEPLRAASSQISRYDWVVLTSQNAATRFLDEIFREGDARRLATTKIASIGGRTSASLRGYGLRADLEPSTSTAEGLSSALLEVLEDRARVLMPRAKVAREHLPNALREAGHDVDIVTAYETLGPDEETVSALRALFRDDPPDIVTFTSSSTVSHLVTTLDTLSPILNEECTLASIGPITTATATKLGLLIDVTVKVSSTSALVDALVQRYSPQDA